MELTAALALLEAIKELPRPAQLSIRTDSRYLIDGFSKWIQGWKRKGWRTASGGAVLNRDLWELLDQARLEGVSLVHVKGHSGDPDNDRCDAIAVAFSKGQMPAMAAGEVIATARIEADVPADAPGPAIADPAPAPLQQLLSRCELADRFASLGYGLSLVELAQLVEQPLQQLERRSGSWRWRDWQVLPLEGGRWRLQRDEGGLGARE